VCSSPNCTPDVGAAYVFARSGTTWTEEQKLSSASLQSEAHFGQTVALSGTTLVAASPWHGVNVRDAATGHITSQHFAGTVEVFIRGPLRWTAQATLEASDALTYDLAGSALAVSGNTLIVGAPGNLTGSSALAGRAMVYTRSGTTWTRQPDVTAADGAANDHFGASLALSGTTLVVGAPGDDDAGDASGSAYVLVGSGGTWTTEQKLTAPDAAAGAKLGSSVAVVSSDRVLVGAVGAGKIYSFSRSGGSWSNDAIYTACSGSPGQSLAASGSLAVSATDGAWVFDLADPSTACVGN
jgi:hypothetical protein